MEARPGSESDGASRSKIVLLAAPDIVPNWNCINELYLHPLKVVRPYQHLATSSLTAHTFEI